MIDRILSALVALSLALLAWLYLRSRDQEMLDNVPVPVQVSLTRSQAEQYDIEVNGPSEVPVSFTGPPSRMRELRSLLQHGALQIEMAVTVPEDRLKESRYLDTVRIDAPDVHAPPGVTPIVGEGRNRISVTLHRLVERRLPVRLDHVGDERLGPVTFEPPVVLVRGPQDVLERLRNVPTQPFALAAPPETTPGQEARLTASVPLVRDVEGRPVRTVPRAVTAHLTLQPQQKLYELNDVPVQFLCPANFSLRPVFSDDRAGKITVRLLGPAAAEPPAVVAYIDLSGRKWEAGLYEEPLKLQLPRDVQLAQAPPRMVTFQLVPTEPAVKSPGMPSTTR